MTRSAGRGAGGVVRARVYGCGGWRWTTPRTPGTWRTIRGHARRSPGRGRRAGAGGAVLLDGDRRAGSRRRGRRRRRTGTGTCAARCGFGPAVVELLARGTGCSSRSARTRCWSSRSARSSTTPTAPSRGDRIAAARGRWPAAAADLDGRAVRPRRGRGLERRPAATPVRAAWTCRPTPSTTGTTGCTRPNPATDAADRGRRRADADFWAARRAADLDSLAELLELGSTDERGALDTVVPVLAEWRRQAPREVDRREAALPRHLAAPRTRGRRGAGRPLALVVPSIAGRQ